jgi:hypothetical protein
MTSFSLKSFESLICEVFTFLRGKRSGPNAPSCVRKVYKSKQTTYTFYKIEWELKIETLGLDQISHKHCRLQET